MPKLLRHGYPTVWFFLLYAFYLVVGIGSLWLMLQAAYLLEGF